MSLAMKSAIRVLPNSSTCISSMKSSDVKASLEWRLVEIQAGKALTLQMRLGGPAKSQILVFPEAVWLKNAHELRSEGGGNGSHLTDVLGVHLRPCRQIVVPLPVLFLAAAAGFC